MKCWQKTILRRRNSRKKKVFTILISGVQRIDGRITSINEKEKRQQKRRRRKKVCSNNTMTW